MKSITGLAVKSITGRRDPKIIADILRKGTVGGMEGAEEFICPACGGFCWGTAWEGSERDPNWERAYGHCNSWIMRGDGSAEHCHFAWMRSEDAWVFHPLGTRDEIAEGRES